MQTEVKCIKQECQVHTVMMIRLHLYLERSVCKSNAEIADALKSHEFNRVATRSQGI